MARRGMEKLFIIAGERSGDRHGAGLMAELRALFPVLEIRGLGGQEMNGLAPEVENWAEEAAVVGFVEVLRHYPWFKRKFEETRARVREFQPDAVLLIDYPGFNLRMAKALREEDGFRGKILYYISPQVWAWHRGRIPKMAKWLDLMICIFPFEPAVYEASGLRAVFAGHPLVQHHRERLLGVPREENLIGLFPGSRGREVARIFPVLLETARQMKAADPALKFAASAASPKLEAVMREMLARNPVADLTIETGNSAELMQRAECGAVASGTATLEAAIFEMPHCLVYKVAQGTWIFGNMVIKVKFLGIVNLLAGHGVVKELLQSRCTPEIVAAELRRLHENVEARRMLMLELRQVIGGLTGGPAYQRAAEALAEVVDGREAR